MMNRSKDRCPIWPRYSAEVTWVSGERKNVSRVDSPRAGGEYEIEGEVEWLVSQLTDPPKARLTTRLIDHRRQTGRPLLVREKEIGKAQVAGALQVSDRARRLMELFRHEELFRHGTIGEEIVLFSQSGPEVPPTMEESGQMALAWSESTTKKELMYLCRYLAKRGWIEVKRHPTDTLYSVVVTVEGHAALEVPPRPDSNKVFVAMWLDQSMDKAYEQGIKPGIEDAGYEAFRIDRDPTVDKIDDAIMASIRGCRFLVADFTHDRDGVRGSVYFEAGFARGLGIEVVSTCRTDYLERIHFDTRQYYHIGWEENELNKLRNGIAERIRARLGPGLASSRAQSSP